MGLGWCKLLMVRTHTKKGNKERKNKRGSQKKNAKIMLITFPPYIVRVMVPNEVTTT